VLRRPASLAARRPLDYTPGMDVPLQQLRRYVKQCDPFLPLPAGDPRYVPLDEGTTPVRGKVTAVDALRRKIRLSDAESCQLFSGFPGTGKTTELRRLEAQLATAKDLPTYTIYIDFEDYIDRYAPISITDVLRVVAYCMDRAAMIAEGGDPDEAPGYLKRFFDRLSSTDVDLKTAGFGAYGASLMLELKNNPSFRQRTEAILQGRFQQFAVEARDAMSQAVVRLRKAKGVAAERVVVIADGLEKFTALREEDRATMETAVETVFLTHRELMHLPCHAIYTFPLWLRVRNAQLGAAYGREPVVLPMVKVREPEGAPYEVGIEKMVEIIRRRIDDLPAIFGDDLDRTLRPLIEASGGYPRDLLRMVRTLLTDTESFPLTPDKTEQVVRDLARSYADTILGTYVDVLARVGTTHDLPKDDAAQLAMFGFLFERWLILAYRNGEEWYDLHPLVRRAPMVQARLSQKTG
jgi:hypothetical protein